MTSQLAAGASARGLFGDNDAGENSGWEGRARARLSARRHALDRRRGSLRELHDERSRRAMPERTVEARTPCPTARSSSSASPWMPRSRCARSTGSSISALAYNLIDTESPLAPLMVGGSAAFGIGDGLHARRRRAGRPQHAQAVQRRQAAWSGGGLEYLAQGVIPLRAATCTTRGASHHARHRAASATSSSALASR